MPNLQNQRVAILCGGQGMRLREETEHKPKPMVEIGGRPIVWRIMRHFAKYGFHRFVLGLGYRGDFIREYFLNYEYMNADFTNSLAHGNRSIQVHPNNVKEELNWEVTLAETGEKSMTGARIKKIDSPVAGRANVLVVPDLEAGNMLAKALTFLAGADAAGLVLGARVPILLTSRADSVKTRLASCAVAVLVAKARREQAARAVA